MANHPWNDNYAAGDLPWDTGQPEPELVAFVAAHRVVGSRALEVGCGTGTNAVWLAEQGFDVAAVDIAPLAIEKARAKDPQRRCRFEALDFLTTRPPGGPFDLVFDRGVFHIFDGAEERARFAAQVASILRPGGVWLCLAGSTEGPPREWGPPRRSARDLILAMEPELEILELISTEFRVHDSKAWRCVSRRREVDAQPPTRRD